MSRGRKKLDRSIVEGPIGSAVWKLGWPTMLQNVIGGMQGIVDHAMVGNYVGFTGNAAIGVSWQIFLVIVVFISSLFTGMGVLVARFAGADDPDMVDRTVYNAFITALFLAVGIMAPLGWVASPMLLDLVNAAPEVQAEALPYIRIMFVFSFGMLIFFMLGGALRSAGDAKTPLRLGILMTVMNIVFNIVLIRGFGPIPAFGTKGAAMGTALAGGIISIIAVYHLLKGDWVVHFTSRMGWKPDFEIIKELFRFGLPTGFQGVAMNVAGVFLLRFIGSLENSAAAQAAYAVSYGQLFSFVTWTSVGLMGATAAVAGQNLGAGKPERTFKAVRTSAGFGLIAAAFLGSAYVLIPETLLGVFGMDDPIALGISIELLRYLAVSAFFITVALTFTGGLQGTGDTKSPLYISIISQIVVPLGLCWFWQETRGLESTDIWLAIVLGHMTRAALSVGRFQQGKWQNIEVRVGAKK